MAPPICGSVPPPNSSIRMMLPSLQYFIMFFIFVRCDEYVLRSSSMLCSSPMSMKMPLKMPAWLRSFIGTGIPHCSIYCSSPTVLRQTDLPPALGPEMRRILFLSFRAISSGTTFLLCFSRFILKSGCIASNQSIVLLFSMAGFTALVSMPNNAFALMKSILARNSYETSIAGICGRISLENSVRILIISLRSSPSSSLILLLASTTSAGSMKTVFPVADSSCTIPLIFLFMPGATGITSLPSRTVGVTSLSTKPSDCACLNIEFRLRDMLPAVDDSSRRIDKSCGEALSLIFPNLSSILLIFDVSCGKTMMSSASLHRVGN